MICEIAQFWGGGRHLRQRSRAPCAKGQETFTQTAAGEPKRSYREIHLALQGNRLGATGKSVSEYWISPLPQCRLKGVDGEAVGGGGNFFFFMGEGVTMIASSGR